MDRVDSFGDIGDRVQSTAEFETLWEQALECRVARVLGNDPKIAVGPSDLADAEGVRMRNLRDIGHHAPKSVDGPRIFEDVGPRNSDQIRPALTLVPSAIDGVETAATQGFREFVSISQIGCEGRHWPLAMPFYSWRESRGN